MKDKSTTYLLHGGYTGEDNYLNNSFFAEIGNYGQKILLCYFSRDKKDWDKLFEQDKFRINSLSKLKNQFILADGTNFMNQVRDINVVYFRGGETETLLERLKFHKDLKEIFSGKLIAGTSAGAYMIAEKYFSSSQKKLFKGLGLLNLNVSCHFEESFRNELDKSTEASNLNTIILKDYEWVRIIK